MTPTAANIKPDSDYGSIIDADISRSNGGSFQKATILDQTDPLVVEREKSQNRKKLGVAALLSIALVALGVSMVESKNRQQVVTDDMNAGRSLMEHRFASLLLDDEAFFFPASFSNPSGRRSLLGEEEAAAGADADAPVNPWAAQWSTNKDGFAAVGSYYKSKGKAMKHYYKSLYDPLYNKTAEEAGVANITVNATAPWTSFDWKKDSVGGVALADSYKAIGDAIDAHYKQAFAPVVSATPAGGAGRRFLRALAGDEAADTAATTEDANVAEEEQVPVYDWAADRERGMAVGQHFKELGQQIKDHYAQPFDKTAAKDPTAPADFSPAWIDFKTQGQAIGQYYQEKGLAIARFYEQHKAAAAATADASSTTAANLWTAAAMARSASIAGAGAADMAPVSATTAAASSEDDASTTANAVANDWYIWKMDWQNDKEDALKRHEEMKAKGKSIGQYYRAKFDPTFGAAEMISNALDNLWFPAWGEDADTDKEHGKLLGEYWAAHGKKKMGKEPKKALWTEAPTTVPVAAEASVPAVSSLTWQERREYGKATGKFWEDFYRSRYDPTYDADRDLHW